MRRLLCARIAYITPELAAELQPLHDELPATGEAAAEALSFAGATPTSLALLIDEIIDRIRAIPG